MSFSSCSQSLSWGWTCVKNHFLLSYSYHLSPSLAIELSPGVIMPKRAVPTSRPEILLDARLPMPLYKQLYERFRRVILTGQVERGTRLPSTRQLASELGISRTTVVLAYEHLLLEGYLQSRVGQGTVVAHDLPVPSLLDQPELTELTEPP